jgi:NitT/TauT family transport system substrate-binding protein
MTGRITTLALALALLAAPAAAEDRLKLAVGQKGFWDTAMPWLGQEKGFFRDVGIALDIQWTEGGADTEQAVITGSFDVGIAVGIMGVIGAWAKRAPVAMISAQMTGSPDLYWYVRADNPAHGFKDLAGKTVGFSRPGSSSNLIAAALAKAAGIEVKLVSTGGAAATLTQVMSGQVDAGWSAVPINLNLVQENKIRMIAAGNDAPGVAAQTVRINITNKPTLERRGDALKRFLAAYKRAIDWAYESPEALEMYAKFAQVTPAVVAELRGKYFPKAALALDHIGRIETTMDEAVRAKRLDKPLSPEQTAEMLRPIAELNR